MFKKIVVIGGGTGTSVVLSALKNYPFDLTAIVNVTDSGGSTGRLRTEFGFLPVGDMRQCLAALACGEEGNYIKKILLYRFIKGNGLCGHNLGNLILTALTDIVGSEPKAIEIAARIFRLKGEVLPITTENIQLVARYEDGTEVIGEHYIDEPIHKGSKRIIQLTTRPKANINLRAARAIVKADLIILGPGDLFTSILPNLIINGVKATFAKSKGRIVYIVNLMTRYSQTHNYTAQGHVSEINKYLGRAADYIIVNSGKIPQKIARLYIKEKGYPVKVDLPQHQKAPHFNTGMSRVNLGLSVRGISLKFERSHGHQAGEASHRSISKVIKGNFISSVIIKRRKGDLLQRSYLRHDSKKIAKAIMGLL